MPSAPLPPEKKTEIEDLSQAIREAVDQEIDELAANLLSTADAHLFGDNEFKIRSIALKVAAKAYEQHLARKYTTTRDRARISVLLDSASPIQPGVTAVSSGIAPSS
jgi:hypothetical protein